MIGRRRRLLTIAHSYAVGLNRRLAHELALAGGWDVTAVAPARFRGDFAWHTVEPRGDEACAVDDGARAFHPPRARDALRPRARLPAQAAVGSRPRVGGALHRRRRADRGVDTAGVPLVYATFQNIVKRYPPPFGWFERYALARADAMIAFGHTEPRCSHAAASAGGPCA